MNAATRFVSRLRSLSVVAPAARHRPLLELLVVAGILSGCGTAEPPVAVTPAPSPTSSTESAPQPAAVEQPKVDGAAVLAAISTKLEEGALDEAQQALARANEVADKLTDAERKRLQEFGTELDAKRRARTAERRAARLAEAQQLVEDGKLEDATTAIDDVMKAFPQDEERETARALTKTIEDHRRRRRELAVAMKLLGSSKPNEFRSARTRLVEDPEVAIPLVVEALSGDNPVLASNALEVLRSFGDPERTLPALISVLQKADRAMLWPLAIREIQKSNAPGAGTPLLELALSSSNPEQQIAALTALSGVIDPPATTIVRLLPMLYRDGSTLAPALQAARHAALVNRQIDLVSRRGLELDLTDEQNQQLTGLHERLLAISKLPAGPDTASDPVRAAFAFGALTHLLAPQPLPDVKLLRASAELPESPALAVLDGVWNSIDPAKMWRHPVDRELTLVLDLGTERTVTGLRIWNENEQNGRHRGWKEVNVYVSNTPASLTPVARGIVAQAPGVADAPDFSSMISVPSVTGRYIRLQCINQWQPDGVAGLAEIQVVGY